MSLPSAGKLTRAGKEKNPMTQFSPESQLSGHRGAWHCPASGCRGGGSLRKWPSCMDGLQWHKMKSLGLLQGRF